MGRFASSDALAAAGVTPALGASGATGHQERAGRGKRVLKRVLYRSAFSSISHHERSEAFYGTSQGERSCREAVTGSSRGSARRLTAPASTTGRGGRRPPSGEASVRATALPRCACSGGRTTRGNARAAGRRAGGCRREAGFNAARTPYPSTAGSGSGVVRAGGDPARVAPRRSGGDPLPLQNRDARRAPARTTRWPDRASRRPRPRRARAVRRRRASEASREDSHRRPARAARSATRSRRSIACSRVGRQGQNAPKPKSHVTSFILNVDSPRVSVASVTQPLVASRVAAPAEKAQPLTFSGSIITYIQYEYQ
jgi:hypothetical protein